jgi:hypothetical protein
MEPKRKNFHEGSEAKQINQSPPNLVYGFLLFSRKSLSTPFAKETYF